MVISTRGAEITQMKGRTVENLTSSQKNETHLLYMCVCRRLSLSQGAVHKIRHQSRGRGLPKEKMILLNNKAYLVKVMNEGGTGYQKYQKIDYVCYERPPSIVYIVR